MTARARYFLLAALAVVLAGCGYHVAGKGGEMPGGVTEVSIPVFENRTAKPDIEGVITGAFVNEFNTTVNVTGSAPAVLTGVVKEYNLNAVSYTKSDVNQEYRLTVVLDLVLTVPAREDGEEDVEYVEVDEDGREVREVLWKDHHVTDYEDFVVNPSDINATRDAEQTALEKIAEDTARLVKERMLGDF